MRQEGSCQQCTWDPSIRPSSESSGLRNHWNKRLKPLVLEWNWKIRFFSMNSSTLQIKSSENLCWEDKGGGAWLGDIGGGCGG